MVGEVGYDESVGRAAQDELVEDGGRVERSIDVRERVVGTGNVVELPGRRQQVGVDHEQEQVVFEVGVHRLEDQRNLLRLAAVDEPSSSSVRPRVDIVKEPVGRARAQVAGSAM